MTRYRPPIGGLFRLRGPEPERPGQTELRSEARDAIRNFVRVLERLDREQEAAPKPRAPRRRAKP